MAKYGAAIFDVFGTVVDWRSGVAAEVTKAYRAKGLDVNAEAFADEWRGEYQPAMQRIRSGDRGYVPLDILHRENLEIVLKQRNQLDLFAAEELADLNYAWEKLPPWPDSRQGLADLKRIMPVATCSNGSIALMVRLARFGRLEWDCIVGAEIAQSYKPDPKVYQRSAAALGFSPDEVIMVATHNDDLAAARKAGLATGYFPRPDELGVGVKSDLAPAQDWDVIAADMIDMAQKLR